MTTPASATLLEPFFLNLLARLGLDPSDLPDSPMPRARRPTIGMSDSTPLKLWELARVIDVVVSYSAMINVGRQRDRRRTLPFRGIDLSAAAGGYWYRPVRGPSQPLVGSPLQLLDAVIRHGLDYRLALIERDPDVAPLLERNVNTSMRHLGASRHRVDVLKGDFCQKAYDWIKQYVRPWMLGLMIVDANGVFDSPELRTIAQLPELKRVDVALHIGADLAKWPKRRIPPATIDELQVAFNKEFWQVAPRRGQYQWAWIYGTNNRKMRVLSERRFAAADSEIGLARLDVLRTTRSARIKREQMDMFSTLETVAAAASD